MINNSSYRKAFIIAVLIHFSLGFMLAYESTHSRPVLTKETENQPGDMSANPPQKEIIKAVSVDNQEVMKAVQDLKQARFKQLQAEQIRQNDLIKKAEAAKMQRLQEQQRLIKLKEETEKIALERKKQIIEEQKRLKQLAAEKEQEAKRLEELKKRQQVLEKKQRDAEKIALQAEVEKKKAEQAKVTAEKVKAEQAAAERLAAQEAAAQNARIAGEVDKYKAMIVNAIGRRWILPENIDTRLSSQFRIRLAPDGAVLEVTLIRSSGDPILDRSAQAAIYKASPLPVPSDPATFNLFREISLTVRPENVRG